MAYKRQNAGDGMNSFIGTLYSAVVDHQEHFAQWALKTAAERMPLAWVRWVVIGPEGERELAVAGKSLPKTAEFSTLRIEVMEPADNARHQFSWQRGAPAGFTEDERHFLSATLEHLVCAERLARRFQALLREARVGALEPIGFAIVDAVGVIESADPVFEDYLRRCHDAWDGRTLPFEINLADEQLKHTQSCRGLFFRIDKAAEKLHVRVSNDRRLPSVSTRELQVARKLAGGLTFKEIARELGLAPSTVSTHAYNLYDKLGFRRRAQLVEWVLKYGKAR